MLPSRHTHNSKSFSWPSKNIQFYNGTLLVHDCSTYSDSTFKKVCTGFIIFSCSETYLLYHFKWFSQGREMGQGGQILGAGQWLCDIGWLKISGPFYSSKKSILGGWKKFNFWFSHLQVWLGTNVQLWPHPLSLWCVTAEPFEMVQ